MQTRAWSYVQRGQSMGPIPEDRLRSMLATGDLYWDDLVWREGMADWLPARQVPELVAAPPVSPSAPAHPLPHAIPARTPIQLDPHPETPMASGANPTVVVPFQAVEWLRQTKPWVRFLAVLGLVATALSVGLILFLSLTMGAMPGMRVGLERLLPVAMGVFVLALYLPPLLLLNRYANRIGRLVRSGAPGDLEAALQAQKAFWKYIGILTLVILVLYIIGILAVLGMGLMARGFRT